MKHFLSSRGENSPPFKGAAASSIAFDPERCSPGAEVSQQPAIIQVRGMATLKAKRRKLANSAQGGVAWGCLEGRQVLRARPVEVTFET